MLRGCRSFALGGVEPFWRTNGVIFLTECTRGAVSRIAFLECEVVAISRGAGNAFRRHRLARASSRVFYGDSTGMGAFDLP